MIRSLRVALFVSVLAPIVLAAQSAPDWSIINRSRTVPPRPTTGAITASDLETRVFRFAADSMEGRVLGARGNTVGTAYIAAELARLGLEPAGENGTFFQTLPLVTRPLDADRSLMVAGKTFVAWRDFVPRDQSPGQRAISGVPVVWGGDFADASGRLSGAAATGKVVVIYSSQTLPGNPPGIPNRGLVNRAYFQAAGVLIIGSDSIPPETLGSYQVPGGAILWDELPEAPSYVYISQAMANAMFNGSPIGKPVGTAGTAVQGDITWQNVPAEFPARNVVAILRGSDPVLRNEFVAVGAHNDHVGMGQPVAHDSMYVLNHLFRPQGAEDQMPELTAAQVAQVNRILAEIRATNGGASARLDSVYNGADDDGSGSMAVLELAEQFATAGQRPRRSMIFVWHVGEEAGLFGAQWFTDHPTVPRESIVAQLNIDMVGRGKSSDIAGQTKAGAPVSGSDDYVQLIGSRRLSTALGDLAESVNGSGGHGMRLDYSLDADGHPQNIYCRSDHYMYARYGIPVIFFSTGGHSDYHQLTDEPQYLDYTHMERVTRYIGDLARHVADLPARPVVDKPVPDPKGNCRQ